MENSKYKNKKDIFLVVYILGICLSTVIGNVMVNNSELGSKAFNAAGVIFSIFIYVCIWLVPPFLELKLAKKVDPLEYLKLRKNKLKGVRIGIIFSGILIALSILKLLIFKRAAGSFNASLMSVLLVLPVGFFEEIPFRGYILQRLEEKQKFWNANIITSLVFAAAHIPNWSFEGVGIIAALYSAFIMSLVFGYVFNKSRSLFSVIIMHSVYNLMMAVIA